jgi:putative zinc finger/helix-turn-helix YgiT family protein
MRHNSSRTEGHKPSNRPFPWRCPRCVTPDAVHLETVPYTVEITHDGQIYKLEIPELQIPRCRSCQELIFSHAVDEQIRRVLRAHLRLITPEQIREGRKALHLTQEELAERLGVAKETISHWETGGLIQSRAIDNLLRVYYAFPEVRTALQGVNQNPSLGINVLDSSS